MSLGLGLNLYKTKATGASGSGAYSNTKSLLFDGVDDYVDLGSSTGLNFSSDFTLSAWVKTSLIGANQFIIDASTSASLGHGYSVRILADGTVRFWSYSATFSLNSISTLSVDTWYNITVTHDRTNAINKIYINGALDNSGASGGFNPTATTNLRLANSVLFGGTFNGFLDEVSFFSDLLSASDVLSIGGTIPIDLSTFSTPPITWLRMGDGDTAFPTIPDVIGTNDGTAYNENEATMVVPDVP